MQKTGSFSSAHLRLLRGVSRSFYLTIRLLPRALRPPIAVAYLLARATDTVADTTALGQPERQQLLTDLMASIDSADGLLQCKPAALAAFAELQSDAHERALMLTLPDFLPLLCALPPDDQGSVRWVLGHIAQGQMLDVSRFGRGFAALGSEAELREYTWLVAGCVGEFWTELCARHLPGFATETPESLRALGRHYGMGLQRLNILRDAGADLAASRCYLPENLLTPLGLSPQTLQQAALAQDALALNCLAPLWRDQLQQTQVHLADGLRYSMALTSRRLRLATALPALLGARTVALLAEAGPMALSQKIKMPRSELRTLLWRLLLAGVSVHALQREFDRLSSPVQA